MRVTTEESRLELDERTESAYSVSPPLWREVVREVLVELFPFAAPRQQEDYLPDYRRRDDFCFLADIESARTLFHFETISLLLIGAVVFVVLISGTAALLSIPSLVVLSALIALLYFLLMLFKLVVVSRALSFPLIDFPKQVIAEVPEEEWPLYTVLVPLRDEASVAPQIVAALSAIDYPLEKLDLMITLEEYDVATFDALKAAGMPDHWRVVVLPDVTPKTKPKALNVAFLQARGEFLVIYDAEIIPDSDQLKKAALAFQEHSHVACLQTRLDHYNVDYNVLTKLFNTEFSFYYDMFLPGLQRFNFPIPLSGHSTHFRIEALQRIGGWDPYNVAEDCDVGIRLYRYGYRTGMLNSLSREEATTTLDSWIKQRTRWMKGFIQASVVHLRHPRHLWRELGGARNFFAFLIAVPGTVFLNILNVLTWFLLVLWWITGSSFIQTLYPGPVLYLANTAFIVGVFVFIYLNLIAIYRRGRFHLVRYFFLTPFYWMLLAIATVRAAIQLVTKPHMWEKTVHGTHLGKASADSR